MGRLRGALTAHAACVGGEPEERLAGRLERALTARAVLIRRQRDPPRWAGTHMSAGIARVGGGGRKGGRVAGLGVGGGEKRARRTWE